MEEISEIEEKIERFVESSRYTSIIEQLVIKEEVIFEIF